MTRQLLCQACGQYSDYNGGKLPPPEVLARRHRLPKSRGTKEEIARRRCLQCGARSPGTSVKACWLRHPVTRAGWYCKPCYDKECRRLKKEQQAGSGTSTQQPSQQQQQPSRPPPLPQQSGAAGGPPAQAVHQQQVDGSESSSATVGAAPLPAVLLLPSLAAVLAAAWAATLHPTGPPQPPAAQQPPAPPAGLLGLLEVAAAEPAAAAAGLTIDVVEDMAAHLHRLTDGQVRAGCRLCTGALATQVLY